MWTPSSMLCHDIKLNIARLPQIHMHITCTSEHTCDYRNVLWTLAFTVYAYGITQKRSRTIWYRKLAKGQQFARALVRMICVCIWYTPTYNMHNMSSKYRPKCGALTFKTIYIHTVHEHVRVYLTMCRAHTRRYERVCSRFLQVYSGGRHARFRACRINGRAHTCAR